MTNEEKADVRALAETLHDFRHFVQRNAAIWKRGANWSGNPMWGRVANILDKFDCNDGPGDKTGHGYFWQEPEYYCE